MKGCVIMMKVWVVLINDGDWEPDWEIMGIFDSEDKANAYAADYRVAHPHAELDVDYYVMNERIRSC